MLVRIEAPMMKEPNIGTYTWILHQTAATGNSMLLPLRRKVNFAQIDANGMYLHVDDPPC